MASLETKINADFLIAVFIKIYEAYSLKEWLSSSPLMAATANNFLYITIPEEFDQQYLVLYPTTYALVCSVCV